jgi:hypothetical protein
MKGVSMIRRFALVAALLVLLLLPSAAQPAASHQQGFLLGAQMQPRKIAQLAYGVGITDFYELARATSIALAESQGYTRAYNDNFDANGKLLSRDVGIFQINIPASQVGTAIETDLYDPAKNVAAMKRLFDARGWQPWVAYTSKVYLHDTYIRRASLGLMNMEAEMLVRAARDDGQLPKTPVPMLSQKQLATFLSLYP